MSFSREQLRRLAHGASKGGRRGASGPGAPLSSPNDRVRRARRARGGILCRRPHVAASRLAFNVLYRMFRQDGRADEVAFISRQTDSASYDFAELARRFEQHGWKVTMHLKKVRPRNLPSYVGHVVAEIRLLGRCKLVVLDRYDPVVSLIDFDCEPRPEEDAPDGPVNLDFPESPVVLQLWHAFGAFKKFGFQYVDTLEGHSADFTADWRIHRNYSWVACSGEGARAAFAEAFSCPASRVVALRRPEYDELVAMGSASEPGAPPETAPARKRVLMAPTLRSSGQVDHPFRDLHASRAEFEAAIGDGADIVWAFHPLEENLPAPGNVSAELLDCDIVVTDYSSLVYEAYLLKKPVLFYVPDIGSYRVTPGLNRDPLEHAPALCSLGSAELAESLRSIVADPGAYPQDQLERFVGDAFANAADPLDFLLARLEPTSASSPSS